MQQKQYSLGNILHKFGVGKLCFTKNKCINSITITYCLEIVGFLLLLLFFKNKKHSYNACPIGIRLKFCMTQSGN